MTTEHRSPDRLRITEIFYSIQGESTTVGLPTVFVRLTGCPLRCTYCDTEYAFQGGDWMTFDEILQQMKTFNSPYVTVTGGEPMAQKSCTGFLKMLCDTGYNVSLETSGALSLSDVDPRVVKVMDLKTPGSGESEKNLFSNIDNLDNKDQLKFVICNRHDYDWSKEVIKNYNLTQRCEILLSPSFGQVDIKSLAQWILQDQLHVRLQAQLHKVIWGNEPGR